jgi:uncharacterized membrane protein YcgQ (UPF0703/DUF1980 family)
MLEALSGKQGVRAGTGQLMNINNEQNYISITQHAFMAYSKTIWFVLYVLMHTHISTLQAWQNGKYLKCHLCQHLETSLYIVNTTPKHPFPNRLLDSDTAFPRAEKR